MGCWGYFNDQNDGTADKWDEIIERIIASNHIDIDDDYNAKDKWIQENLKTIADTLALEGSMDPGIFMRVVRGGSFSGLGDLDFTNPKPNPIPKSIFCHPALAALAKHGMSKCDTTELPIHFKEAHAIQLEIIDAILSAPIGKYNTMIEWQKQPSKKRRREEQDT